MEAVLFVGIQGSGKTTFYRERFFETHVRISRDMLKTPYRERLLVAACLKARQPFVLDDTNALRSKRAEYIVPARAAGFRAIGYFFRCAPGDALRRNRLRPESRIIPPEGVMATYKRLQPPSWSEGFDELHIVEINAANEFVVSEQKPEGS